MKFRSFLLGLGLFCLFAFLPIIAFAAGDDAAATTSLDATLQLAAGGKQIQFGPAAVALIGLVFTAIGTGLRWLVSFLFGTSGKLPLPDETRALLGHAIDAGIALAEAKVKERVAQLQPYEVKSETVAAAANFVLTAAPQVIAMLGLTEAKLQSLIEDKLHMREQLTDELAT